MLKASEIYGWEPTKQSSELALEWVQTRITEILDESEFDEYGYVADVEQRIKLVILDAFYALKLLKDGYSSEEVESLFPYL